MNRPEVFGKYLLIDLVSVGGMAEVFKAMNVGVGGFQKILAIKRVLPHVAEDPAFIKMFIDEANIAGQIHHANVAQIYDLGEIDGAYFIAMEFVEGRDLRAAYDRIKKLRKPFPVELSVYIATQILSGLDYAHRKTDSTLEPLNIVHRDVSPPNVLLSFMGEVKLIDFGIAKAAKKASKTQAGVLKGKFGYMSPEQVRGMPVDGRSDVFSVGIILHEMLAGRRLFVGDSDFATLEKVRGLEIEPPSVFNGSVKPELDAIVMRSMERDVKKRYPSAQEMMLDLQRFALSQENIFTDQALAEWMQKTFAEDLAQAKARMIEIDQMDLSLLGIDAEAMAQAEVRSMRKEKILASERAKEEEEPMLPEKESAAPSEMKKESDSKSEAKIVNAEKTETKISDKSEKSRKKKKKDKKKAETVTASERKPKPETKPEPEPKPEPPKPEGPPSLTGWIAGLISLFILLVGAGAFGLSQVNDRTITLNTTGPSGTVIFNANQPEVSVLLGGQPLCATPCRVRNFQAGSHEVNFRKAGFVDDTVTFTVSENKDATVLGSIFPPGTVPAVMYINSDPEGAEIDIDRKFTNEKTPATLHQKAGVDYLVTLKKDGYKPRTLTAILPKEGLKEYSVVLLPTSPSVRITSTPSDAKVYIDRKDTKQRTPTRIADLEAGKKYEIKVDKNGFEAESREITAETDKEHILDITLESRSAAQSEHKAIGGKWGYLNVFTDPQARIYLNGKFSGYYSPAKRIKLEPGRYEMKLVNPEFKLQKSTSITIRGGQTTSYNRRFQVD